jgi:hypothetical protein
MKSEFTEWFEAQHGKRPSNKPTDELMVDRNSKLAVAENAVRLVDACKLWDEKQTSALYAWQAARSNVE